MPTPVLATIAALLAAGSFCVAYGMWFLYGAPGALLSLALVFFSTAALLIKGVR